MPTVAIVFLIVVGGLVLIALALRFSRPKPKCVECGSREGPHIDTGEGEICHRCYYGAGGKP